MKLRDRMLVSNPILKDLITIMDALITAVNTLSSVVFTGEAPHKTDDTADVVSAANAGDLDAVVNLEWALDVAYAAHLGSTSYHIAADSTNTLTATTVYAKIKALADELKTKYNAHRVLTSGSVHGGADSTNVVSAAAVSSKATAVTLLNELKTDFNAHIAMTSGSVHGAADATNPVTLDDLTSSSTWTEIAAMADSIRTKYEAHRVLTADSVHGAADSTNTMTASAVGTLQTSINTYLNEFKTDFNAHILFLTSHYTVDQSMKITAANASSLATSVTLINEAKASFNDHISRASEVAMTVPTLDEL